MYAEINGDSVVTFPYTYDTLIAKNPNTRFPQEHLLDLYAGTEDNLRGNQLTFVVTADEPAYDYRTQLIELDSKPKLVNGVWTLGWSVKTRSAEDQAEIELNEAASVRRKRNELLAQSDWTQGKDIPDSISSAWATYRQALRDVPSQAGFPWNVQWPAA